jgi:fatty acid desaturase
MSASTAIAKVLRVTNPPPHRDSWLARQQNKKKNRTIVCWCFWIFFLAFVAAIVGVIIWLVESGVLDNLGHHDDDDDKKIAAYSS